MNDKRKNTIATAVAVTLAAVLSARTLLEGSRLLTVTFCRNILLTIMKVCFCKSIAIFLEKAPKNWIYLANSERVTP